MKRNKLISDSNKTFRTMDRLSIQLASKQDKRKRRRRDRLANSLFY